MEACVYHLSPWGTNGVIINSCDFLCEGDQGMARPTCMIIYLFPTFHDVIE